MGYTLKGARVNAGYTQREVSEILGISNVTIGNWEKGKTFPKVNQVEKLASLYGVNINDLIFLKTKTT